jgi:hypothetical protein
MPMDMVIYRAEGTVMFLCRALSYRRGLLCCSFYGVGQARASSSGTSNSYRLSTLFTFTPILNLREPIRVSCKTVNTMILAPP